MYKAAIARGIESGMEKVAGGAKPSVRDQLADIYEQKGERDISRGRKMRNAGYLGAIGSFGASFIPGVSKRRGIKNLMRWVAPATLGAAGYTGEAGMRYGDVYKTIGKGVRRGRITAEDQEAMQKKNPSMSILRQELGRMAQMGAGISAKVAAEKGELAGFMEKLREIDKTKKPSTKEELERISKIPLRQRKTQ